MFLHNPSTISKDRALYIFTVLSRVTLYSIKHVCLIWFMLTIFMCLHNPSTIAKENALYIFIVLSRFICAKSSVTIHHQYRRKATSVAKTIETCLQHVNIAMLGNHITVEGNTNSIYIYTLWSISHNKTCVFKNVFFYSIHYPASVV